VRVVQFLITAFIVPGPKPVEQSRRLMNAEKGNLLFA